MNSEVARLKGQIEQEYAAASSGLSGLASVARHAFINRRYEQIDQYRRELAAQVGEREAIKMVIEISDAIQVTP